MQVTDTTKYGEIAAVAPYFEQSAILELKKAAEAKYGRTWGLTIGDFFSCTEGDWSCVGIDLAHLEELTALQYYWMEAFRDMAESLSKTLEALSVAPAPEAREASKMCRPMNLRDSVLVFCREYFGLHSFSAVYDLTIDDLLLAKKDNYNKAIFEKTMAEIQKRKSKSK